MARWLLTCFPGCGRSRNERGQALVEYGLLLGLIAMVGVAGVLALGGSVGILYDTLHAIASAL